MRTKRSPWKLARWGKLLPLLIVCQTLGCLPDNGFKQVLGENIVLTAAVTIQSITSVVFNSLFGYI